MKLRIRLSLFAMTCVALAACSSNPAGPSSSSDGTNQNPAVNTATPYIQIAYAGFVGASLSTSDPAPCPTVDCTIPDPPEIPRALTFPGTDAAEFHYPAAAGQTYAIVGTVQPRASGGAPAFNVLAELHAAVGLRSALPGNVPTGLPPALAIPFSSFRFNGLPYDPNIVAFDGPDRCSAVVVQQFGNSGGRPVRFKISFTVTGYQRQVGGGIPPGSCSAL